MYLGAPYLLGTTTDRRENDLNTLKYPTKIRKDLTLVFSFIYFLKFYYTFSRDEYSTLILE